MAKGKKITQQSDPKHWILHHLKNDKNLKKQPQMTLDEAWNLVGEACYAYSNKEVRHALMLIRADVAENSRDRICRNIETLKKRIEIKKMMKPIPNHDDHMTISEFIAACYSGLFTDDDGYGCYATNDKMFQYEIVIPSDLSIKHLLKPLDEYTHVVWFKRNNKTI